MFAGLQNSHNQPYKFLHIPAAVSVHFAVFSHLSAPKGQIQAGQYTRAYCYGAEHLMKMTDLLPTLQNLISARVEVGTSQG